MGKEYKWPGGWPKVGERISWAGGESTGVVVTPEEFKKARGFNLSDGHIPWREVGRSIIWQSPLDELRPIDEQPEQPEQLKQPERPEQEKPARRWFLFDKRNVRCCDDTRSWFYRSQDVGAIWMASTWQPTQMDTLVSNYGYVEYDEPTALAYHKEQGWPLPPCMGPEVSGDEKGIIRGDPRVGELTTAVCPELATSVGKFLYGTAVDVTSINENNEPQATEEWAAVLRENNEPQEAAERMCVMAENFRKDPRCPKCRKERLYQTLVWNENENLFHCCCSNCGAKYKMFGYDAPRVPGPTTDILPRAKAYAIAVGKRLAWKAAKAAVLLYAGASGTTWYVLNHELGQSVSLVEAAGMVNRYIGALLT